ncbi:MAG: prolipoprotein diacylglyceryl transferase family protein, partial [Candidatus Roseilinea sp.]|uniref:prolipoprotein diacylglyceryl transferase family protein n=1 Tax=Candidatus Roseilinea sp. TaxID=2838777 RepID=UPI00404B2D97
AGAALLNGESLGQPTTLPWAVMIWGENRHPVPVYELAALAVIVLGSLRLLGRDLPPGAVALGALAAYAFARVAIDGFRADVPLLAGLRVTQIAGVVVCAVALWMLGELPPSSASGSVDDRTVDD